jgi:hypothetical protein
MIFLPVLLALVSVGLSAQPTLAGVEVYGARKIAKERIMRLVGATAGTQLPKSKGEIEEKLEALEGIVTARVEAFCCEQGRPILYVGLEERGAAAFQYKAWPEKEIELPQEITSAWGDFTAALARASADGDTVEDLSKGHSLMQNLPARVAQERFVGLAELNLAALRDVLANAFDPEQRATAAYVLGYAPVKRDVLNDLQSAMQDPAISVRANAARALRAFAEYTPEDPELRVTVRPTWFVEMLNSVELHDRVEGARALASFTEKPEEHLAAQLKERALPSLLEMAAWQHLPHALPAFLVAGRLAGWPEDRLTKAWASGNRDSALKEIAKALTAKPKSK